jgi:hypothetical protein
MPFDKANVSIITIEFLNTYGKVLKKKPGGT